MSFDLISCSESFETPISPNDYADYCDEFKEDDQLSAEIFEVMTDVHGQNERGDDADEQLISCPL